MLRGNVWESSHSQKKPADLSQLYRVFQKITLISEYTQVGTVSKIWLHDITSMADCKMQFKKLKTGVLRECLRSFEFPITREIQQVKHFQHFLLKRLNSNYDTKQQSPV